MTARHEAPTGNGTQDAAAAGSRWQRITERVLGIVGGIAVFLGLFILFAGEDQYLGIDRDYSWRVGDISPAWAYGLLIGGAILLVIVLASVLQRRSRGRT